MVLSVSTAKGVSARVSICQAGIELVHKTTRGLLVSCRQFSFISCPLYHICPCVPEDKHSCGNRYKSPQHDRKRSRWHLLAGFNPSVVQTQFTENKGAGQWLIQSRSMKQLQKNKHWMNEAVNEWSISTTFAARLCHVLKGKQIPTFVLSSFILYFILLCAIILSSWKGSIMWIMHFIAFQGSFKFQNCLGQQDELYCYCSHFTNHLNMSHQLHTDPYSEVIFQMFMSAKTNHTLLFPCGWALGDFWDSAFCPKTHSGWMWHNYSKLLKSAH